MRSFEKDPSAFKDYGFNWLGFLAGDTIDTSTWTVTPADDATLVLQSQSKSATATAVWVSGGTLKRRYTITNRITTVGGRTDERSFQVYIKEQ